MVWVSVKATSALEWDSSGKSMGSCLYNFSRRPRFPGYLRVSLLFNTGCNLILGWCGVRSSVPSLYSWVSSSFGRSILQTFIYSPLSRKSALLLVLIIVSLKHIPSARSLHSTIRCLFSRRFWLRWVYSLDLRCLHFSLSGIFREWDLSCSVDYGRSFLPALSCSSSLTTGILYYNDRWSVGSWKLFMLQSELWYFRSISSSTLTISATCCTLMSISWVLFICIVTSTLN
jgi:hypothetical protein